MRVGQQDCCAGDADYESSWLEGASWFGVNAAHTLGEEPDQSEPGVEDAARTRLASGVVPVFPFLEVPGDELDELDEGEEDYFSDG